MNAKQTIAARLRRLPTGAIAEAHWYLADGLDTFPVIDASALRVCRDMLRAELTRRGYRRPARRSKT